MRVSLTPLGRAQFDLLDPPGLVGAGLVPVDVLEADAVLVAEPAAHVDRGGVCPFGRADLLALEVLGAPDLALLVDVERREAEQPRADHRQADDVGILARDLRHELGERQFGGVPFAVEREAREYLVMAEHRPGGARCPPPARSPAGSRGNGRSRSWRSKASDGSWTPRRGRYPRPALEHEPARRKPLRWRSEPSFAAQRAGRASVDRNET